MAGPKGSRPAGVAAAAGGLALAALLLVSQGTNPAPLRFVVVLLLLLTEGLWVAGWLLAAVGYGWPLRRAMLGSAGRWGFLAQGALGAGALLLIDWSLAWAGLLRPAAVWAAAGVGWALLAGQVARDGPKRRTPATGRLAPSWVLFAPAAGLLLGACTVAPGVLWSSEHRAYDVLEYHLQLPKEWVRIGRMVPLDHNAYSYLPNLVETGYTHLAVWRGSVLDAAYSAQLLHATLAMLAAAAVGALVVRVGRVASGSGAASQRAGLLAAAGYLATPWTLVTGSLAYTDQAAIAFGAVAVGLALPVGGGDTLDRDPRPPGAALAAGGLCGVATLCKLSAAGLFGAPVAALLAMGVRGERGRVPRLAAFLAGSGAVVGVWAIRNGVWTGNPVFPMFAETLGLGPFSPEQAERWRTAHRPDAGFAEAWGRLWRAGVLHFQFGYLVWPAAAAAGGWLLARRPWRRPVAGLWLMVAIQIVFWATMTHRQSRFLLPVLVPAVTLVGLWIASARQRWAVAAGTVWVVVLTLASGALYLGQPRPRDSEMESPLRSLRGLVEGLAGRSPAPWVGGVREVRAGQDFKPYASLNALPEGSRLFAEGFARPLYVRRPVTYHTAWDASPLGRPLEKGPLAAKQWLQSHGYTHLLVNRAMIRRWRRAPDYGYDPRVTLDRLDALVARPDVRRVKRWNGLVLYRVVATDRPATGRSPGTTTRRGRPSGDRRR